MPMVAASNKSATAIVFIIKFRSLNISQSIDTKNENINIYSNRTLDPGAVISDIAEVSPGRMDKFPEAIMINPNRIRHLIAELDLKNTHPNKNAPNRKIEICKYLSFQIEYLYILL